MLKLRLTASTLTLYLTCPYKFYLNQMVGLMSKSKGVEQVLGSLVHLGLEERFRSDLDEALDLIAGKCEEFFADVSRDFLDGDFLRKMETIAKSMVRCIPERWNPKNMSAAEEEFCIPFDDQISFAGKMDGVSKYENHNYVRDYKTVGSFSRNTLTDLLRRNFQGNFYLYVMTRLKGADVDGFEFMMIKRPGIKQTKKETVGQYLRRVEKEYSTETEKYFQENRVLISEREMTEFAVNLMSIVFEIKGRIKSHGWVKNYTQCAGYGTGCVYLPVCNGEIGCRDRYLEMGPDHHPELSLKGETDGVSKGTE